MIKYFKNNPDPRSSGVKLNLNDTGFLQFLRSKDILTIKYYKNNPRIFFIWHERFIFGI